MFFSPAPVVGGIMAAVVPADEKCLKRCSPAPVCRRRKGGFLKTDVSILFLRAAPKRKKVAEKIF